MTEQAVFEARPVINETGNPVSAAIETLESTIAPNGMVSIPIDVERVVNDLGLQVQKLPLDPGVDGILVKDKAGEPFKAVADSSAHEHRQRFTLAHELGHYVHKYQSVPIEEKMGRVERRDDTSSKGIDYEEIWANKFAASLLMPASIVRKYWGEGLTRAAMAKLFNVSERSMDIRLTTLGLK